MARRHLVAVAPVGGHVRLAHALRHRGRAESVTLDHEDIEAIAQRVAELLTPRASIGLVDARTLAAALGVDREWVYANARRLGAMRLGDGPKAPLRFDVQRARAALEGGPSPDEPATRRRGRPRKSARPSGVKPIRERSTG